MLFLRDFAGLSGGHLKFADYIAHTAASNLANPVLWQTPASYAQPNNIFNQLSCDRSAELRPFPAYFLAGMDWQMLDNAGIAIGNAPVINLVQGLRHARPHEPLYQYLSRPALRICVSQAVADAVRPLANGTVVAIENGVDVAAFNVRRDLGRPIRVALAGIKNPLLAEQVAERLAGKLEIDLMLQFLPRWEYLERVAASSILVAIPLAAEGFYLPALEGMGLGRGVVTMACGGNRGYCHHDINCLITDADADAVAEAVLRMANEQGLLARCVQEALATAARHSIIREREAYHAILGRELKW